MKYSVVLNYLHALSEIKESVYTTFTVYFTNMLEEILSLL